MQQKERLINNNNMVHNTVLSTYIYIVIWLELYVYFLELFLFNKRFGKRKICNNEEFRNIYIYSVGR